MKFIQTIIITCWVLFSLSIITPVFGQASLNTSLIGWWVNRPCLTTDVERNRACLENRGSLQIFDFSNLANPKETGILNTDASISGVSAIGNILYVKMRNYFGAGDPDAFSIDLYIIQHDLLTGLTSYEIDLTLLVFERYQNYSNPFSPSSKIEYTLPKFGYFRLTIYHILGSTYKLLLPPNNHPDIFVPCGIAQMNTIYL